MTRIANVLGWIGTALVVAAVAIRFIRPEQQRIWQRLALAGLVVVVAYLLTQWREFATLWSRRGTRAGALTSASVLLLLAILVGLNYVAGRQHKRWNLTEGGQFTLSDQSPQGTRRPQGAGQRQGVCQGHRVPALPRPPRGLHLREPAAED